MKALRGFITIIILFIAMGAALYPNRVHIADWYRSQTAPSLPPTLTHEQVVTGALPESEDLLIDTALDLVEVAVEANEPQEDLLFDLNEDELPIDFDNEADDFVKEVELESEGDVGAEQVVQDLPLVEEMPVSINLGVPFTPQAPHGDWSLPYQEACEESSIYMVHAYYEGVQEGRIDANIAQKGIDKIVEFENSFFGFYEDTTAQQTSALIESFYGYEKVKLIHNPSVDDIKLELAEGRPVIVPAAGRQLGNPFFTEPGPIYHMLVIRGYTADGKFITNDPGTKRGEAFLYPFDVVMNAMHDWNGGEVQSGKKVVIVIHPN